MENAQLNLLRYKGHAFTQELWPIKGMRPFWGSKRLKSVLIKCQVIHSPSAALLRYDSHAMQFTSLKHAFSILKYIYRVVQPSLQSNFRTLSPPPKETLYPSRYGKQCGDFLKNWKQTCHMTQQCHFWAYTPRKPDLKETRAPQCSSQHCLS